MAKFNYTGLDKGYSYYNGKIDAISRRRALSILEKKGFLVINIKRDKESIIDKLSKISTISRLDKIFFTRHLYTLIEAGIALDQAIKITAEQATNPKFKSILFDVYQKIQEGKTLHTSLEPYRNSFSHFFINLIKVGEKSGSLEDSLMHLLAQQEKDYDLLTKARGALIYPIIIMLAAIVIVTLMMIFVIPNISDILLQYGVELPWTTKLLIGGSNLIINFGYILIMGIVVLILVFYMLQKNVKVKWYIQKILLRLPVVGKIIQEFNLARFSRAMYAMMKSGVSINEALELSSTVCSNQHYQKAIYSSIEYVHKGVSFNKVLMAYPKLFPPITTRMLEVGEKSGKTDHMFDKIAGFYEKSVINKLTNLSTIIEPVLLLFIGLVVAFVGVSVLTPIWKFAETI
ncbi:type II secretion system F family protein [Patescibacteria group bacterium]|nr:type II secretion system F family protein [Patescibacteria group bacterium]